MNVYRQLRTNSKQRVISVVVCAVAACVFALLPVSPAVAFTAVPGKPDMYPISDTGLISNDNITKSTTPKFGGTCRDNTRILLYAGPLVIGSDTCKTGRYIITSVPQTIDGVKSITARALGTWGLSAPSPALKITIDTTAPAPPVITWPAQDAVLNRNSFTILGKGEPYARVGAYFYVCGEGEDLPVFPDGHWWCSVPQVGVLPDGTYRYLFPQIDRAGNSSAPTVLRFTVRANP